MFFWRNNTDKKDKPNYYSSKGVKSDFCQFSNFSKIKGKCVAQLGVVGSTTWSLSLVKTEKMVNVEIHCEPKNPHIVNSDKWSVVGDVVVRLLNQKNKEKSMILNSPRTVFNRKEGKEACWRHSFDDIKEKTGFISDDAVIFHVQVGIVCMEELYAGHFVDFSTPREQETNVVLVVEGNKLHVSKQILSIQSPVFDAMFNGQFAETEMKEIPMQNVEFVPFHLLLQYMHMAPIEICEQNVSKMLELGNRFLIKRLIRDCENFLMDCEMEEEQVVELATVFSLERLLCSKISEKKNIGSLLATFPSETVLSPNASMYFNVRSALLSGGASKA